MSLLLSARSADQKRQVGYPVSADGRLGRTASGRKTQSLGGLLGHSLLLGLLAVPSALHAQAKPAVRHTVEGTVINSAKAPVQGAVVYLENPKSLDVISYLTDEKGYFHFSQISPQTDYELWAEQNGVETKHKFISQFSSHVHFHFTLKLTPDRKKFLGIF